MNIVTRFLFGALGFILAFVPHAVAEESDSVDRDYSSELPRIAPTEVADALATFSIIDGFTLQIAAAEPLIRDPVAVAFDEQGRMFVAEMTGYSERRDEIPGDVRLLTDTDGDGVYDHATTYATDIPWPVAVACYDGGIYVGAAPDILYFKDTNGDGVADTREVVYTGFKLNNVQGMLNSFNWGLDGRIHGSSSANGGDIVAPGVPDWKAVPLRGRDFAFDPRTHALATEAGGAQHGMSFDDWGRRFVCSNSDHIQLITYDDRYASRNPRLAAPPGRISIAEDGPAADVFRTSPVEPWRIVRTRLRVKGITPGLIEGGGRAAGYFTSATGVTIYRGDAWPEEYRGQAFIGDVGGNLVHRKVLVPEGATLVARRADPGREFLTSTDNWFRPVQFANAPDGTLYILDMYRETIEHPDSLPEVIKKHLDLSSGNDRGRIYRVAPQGFGPRVPPNLGAVGDSELVALLSHRNAWHRETAARLIYERQNIALAPRLAQAIQESGTDLGRMTALYALIGLEGADVALKRGAVAAALRDASPRVRQHAILLAEPWLKDSPELQAVLLGMTADPDPLLCLQLTFSLGEFEHPQRAEALAQLALQASDAWMRFAVLSSLRGDAVPVFTAYLSRAGDAAQKDMVLALAKQAQEVGPLGKGREAVRQFAEGLIANGQARTGRWLVLAMGEGLRDSELPEDQRLLSEAIASAIATLDDAAQSVEARVDALPFLEFAPYAVAAPALGALLVQNDAPELQAGAIGLLARFNESAVAETLIGAFAELGPRGRETAVEALFRRPTWTEALVSAMEAGRFIPRDLDSNRRQALLKHEDAGLRARAEALYAVAALSPRNEVVEAHQGVLSMKGDPGRGREIYQKNCAQCHRVKNEGFAVGPDLVTVAQSGAEKILTNILDPNREVNQQYINYTIDTKDLETFSGIVASETASSVTLKRAFGENVTILRDNIESMRSEKLSIMPEGLEQSLQPQDLADVIAFITAP